MELLAASLAKQGSLYTQTTGGFHGGGSASDDGGDMGEVRA